MHQENMAIKTKHVYITGTVFVSMYFDHKKSLNDLIDKDLSDYLDSFHKSQIADPDQNG